MPTSVTLLVVQMVKNLPTVQEIWVRSLGWEDSLEKGLAAYSSTLAWRIPWTEEPGGLQSMGSQSDTTEHLSLHLSDRVEEPWVGRARVLPLLEVCAQASGNITELR